MAFRILHIGKFFPPERGGMETYLADLMHQQRSHGIDARALVHGRPQPDDPAWLQRLRVHIRLIFTPIALGFPWAIHKSLRRFAPDVLHLHMPNVAVFWLLLSRKARRVPWVVHWHSDVTFTRSQTALALAYRLYRPLESAVLAQARFIIATSPPLSGGQPDPAPLAREVRSHCAGVAGHATANIYGRGPIGWCARAGERARTSAPPRLGARAHALAQRQTARALHRAADLLQRF